MKLFSSSPTCPSSCFTDSGKYQNLLWWLLHPCRIILYLKTTMKYFILNAKVHMESHKDPMDTRECFVFGKIWSCRAMSGIIGRSKSPSIVDFIICPLGNFPLIVFVVGQTLFRWSAISMKFPVHTESVTTEFSSFLLCVFVVGAQVRLIHTYIFSNTL